VGHISNHIYCAILLQIVLFIYARDFKPMYIYRPKKSRLIKDTGIQHDFSYQSTGGLLFTLAPGARKCNLKMMWTRKKNEMKLRVNFTTTCCLLYYFCLAISEQSWQEFDQSDCCRREKCTIVDHTANMPSVHVHGLRCGQLCIGRRPLCTPTAVVRHGWPVSYCFPLPHCRCADVLVQLSC
jgi:hypothetical protein